MKSTAFIKTLLFILSGISAASISAAPLNYLPNEILVRYKQNTSTANIQNTVSALGANVVSSNKLDNFHRIIFSGKENIHQRIEELMQNPNVEVAQPNYIYRKMVVPNDPSYPQLWGLHNSAPPVGINAEEAWDHVVNGDCSAVSVAVVDTGINWDHDDLTTNIWSNTGESLTSSDSDGNGYVDDIRGWDFIDNDNDPDDDDGHGTHVAGTIGAVGNNNTGTTGVCWSVSLMPVRVLNAIGVGFTSTIAPGIDYAVANGAKIINMSLGGAGLDDPLVNAAIVNAQNNDVVVVVAAGNDGTDNDSNPYYPCNLDSVNSETIENIICVAALDQNYDLAVFSNYGASNVDVGAPGVNILSEVAGNTTYLVIDNFSPTTPLPGTWLFDDNTRPWPQGPNSDAAEEHIYTDNSFFPPLTIDRVIPPGYYLSDPSGFDLTPPLGPGNYTYEEGVDDTAYVINNLLGYDVTTIEFEADLWVNQGDTVRVVYDDSGSGSIPTTTVPGSEYSFALAGALVPFGFELPTSCATNCSVGFNLQSDTDGNVGYGIDITNVLIKGLAKNNSTYAFYRGTSMATPHVAAVAALAKAKNPNYTYLDIVNAVKFSGDSIGSLSGKTSTGRAVDAYKAITYINAPRGLSVDPSMPIVP